MASAILPLGDQAALIQLDQEAAAVHFSTAVRQCAASWLVDVVQAYTTVAVFFDLNQVSFRQVAAILEPLVVRVSGLPSATPGKVHDIPCCYEFSLDLARITQHTGLPSEQIIHLHGATDYTVYAIGFCPGFPYLGYLSPLLSGVPRLPSPRLQVEDGSVGLTGRQTGIYTLARPGGWNLVGRTPLQLVHVEDEYFPLRTGDRVRFHRIDDKEFGKLYGERL